MSEYQFVAFRAIDGPVSGKNLEYMRQQSSRAEVTAWSFDNEYHYGDFRGNALEMMRRGYDLHLHYANFGIRTLLVRLPHGFPDLKAVKPYLQGESLRFVADKRGRGGTLQVEPFHESGDLDELWEVGEVLDSLVPLRAEILGGDLRPLYIAHLAISKDGNHDPEEAIEGPVPAGLDQLTAAQQALADLYEVSPALLAAAAEGAPPLAAAADLRAEYAAWLDGQSEATKREWLVELLVDTNAVMRAEIVARFRDERNLPSWPTASLKRSMADLQAAAEEVQSAWDTAAAEKTARERSRRLAKMADNPKPYLKQSEELAAERSTQAYREVSQILADLREALAGSSQSGLAEQQARKLKERFPKANRLTAALREHGFVPK